VSTNFAIFLLFFGISFLDAAWGGHWLRVLFWAVMGVGFLLADRREIGKRSEARKGSRP
jgi:hypothetical protein